MNKYQEAKLNMYQAVISYCDLNSAIIGDMEALETSTQQFKNIVSDIVAALQSQVKVISGYSANKTSLRDALTDEAASIASAIYSFAKATDNKVLQEMVKYTVSDFDKLKNGELVAIFRNISGAGRPYISLLGPYNLTAANLNDFNTHIDAFAASMPLPRTAIVTRSGHSTTMRALFELADDLVKGQMDKQARRLKKTNPEFYSAYVQSREIVNSATTRTQIKGVVTNKKTKGPLAGATITILENETSVSTGADGKYVMKPVPTGTYTLKIEMKGFESKTITGVQLQRGKIKSVKVALVAGG